MAVFRYTARDCAGIEFAGVYADVADKSQLRRHLSKMGYELVRSRRQKDISASKKVKVKRAEIISFAYEFAGMYNAGLSIIRCLETYEFQAENPAMKAVIRDIRQHIETGSSLKQAFEKHRRVFSEFFIGMLEAGEAGGKVGQTLGMAAEYLEKQEQLRHKVKSAFTYPMVVGVMCVLIVTAIVTFVIPVFQKLYQQLHASLPAPTLALIFISRFIGNFWYLLLALGALGCYAIRRLRRNENVRARFDSMLLNMPVFGRLNRMIVVSRFIRTFAMMIAAGVSLVEALEFAKNVADNRQMRDIGSVIQEEIMTGNSIISPMSKFSIFPPVVIQMASAGEEAGILPEMLGKAVELIDAHIDRTIKSMLARLEPAISLVMGLTVGAILIAVYLPMFDYMVHLE